MVHIILTWNSHETESEVTEKLAQFLEKDLAKRGDYVEVRQIPPEKTLHAYYRAGGKGDFLEGGAMANRHLISILKSNPGAVVVDLHCGPDYLLLNRGNQKKLFRERRSANKIGKFDQVRNWRTVVDPSFSSSEQIELYSSDYRRRLFYLEFPAVFRDAPAEFRKLGENASQRTRALYFSGLSDFLQSKKRNFFDPLLIRRAGHMIHQSANVDLGKWRRGRNVHKKRIPYPGKQSSELFRKMGKSRKSKRKYSRKRPRI